MLGLSIAAAFAVGAAMGLALARAQLQGRHSAAEARSAQLASLLDQQSAQKAAADAQLRNLVEQVAVLQTKLDAELERAFEQSGNEQKMLDSFDRIARSTLKESTEALVKTAEGSFKLAQESARGELDHQRLKIEHLVKPVEENLLKLEQHIFQSEKSRKEEYGGLFEQMQGLAETNRAVQAQTARLDNVLRASTSQRGRWGEVQLRRVVELAGMSGHCDFVEQATATSEDGVKARADLVVYLPGNTQVPVDAKVPYDAFEEAQNCASPEQRNRLMKSHAKALRAHIDALHKRAYWDVYVPGCGFTVLFVPNEALIDSACAADAALWEYAAEKQVLLATPSTLIALLKMAALGWNQQLQAENATEIVKAGRTLYKRLITAGQHVEKVGRGLGNAVGSYNQLVGSLETRVMPTARKLSDLGLGDEAQSELCEITEVPRSLRSGTYVRPVRAGDAVDDVMGG